MTETPGHTANSFVPPLTVSTAMRLLILAALSGTALTAAPVPKELKAKKSVEARILGTWQIVKTDVGPLPYTMTITFKPGGEKMCIRDSCSAVG